MLILEIYANWNELAVLILFLMVQRLCHKHSCYSNNFSYRGDEGASLVPTPFSSHSTRAMRQLSYIFSNKLFLILLLKLQKKTLDANMAVVWIFPKWSDDFDYYSTHYFNSEVSLEYVICTNKYVVRLDSLNI